MTGAEHGRRVAFLFAAVALLLAVGFGVGSAGDADQFRAHSSPAISAAGAIGSGTGGALDTRVQRETEVRAGQGNPHRDGAGGPPSLGRSPQPWVRTLAATLEHAGHPERLGHILLRGPPGPSA